MRIAHASVEQLSWILGAILINGAAGLSGGVLPPRFVHKNIVGLLAFASGTLLGSAFLDLIPEAFEKGLSPTALALSVLGGFVLFYVVENFLGSHAAGQSGHKHNTVGPMILMGDALHNTADGVAIASAFLIDIRTGITTMLAVIVHELPQEISDFTILVSHGYSRARALIALCVVQFSALLGAGLTLYAHRLATNTTALLLAVSAGGFIYIAAADLLPEMRRRRGPGKGFPIPLSQFLSFLAGLGVLWLIETLLHKA